MVQKHSMMECSSRDSRLPCKPSQGPLEPMASQSEHANASVQLDTKDKAATVSQPYSHTGSIANPEKLGIVHASPNTSTGKAMAFKDDSKRDPLGDITSRNGKVQDGSNVKINKDARYAALKQSTLATNTLLSAGSSNPTFPMRNTIASPESLKKLGKNVGGYPLYGMLTVPRQITARRSARKVAKARYGA